MVKKKDSKVVTGEVVSTVCDKTVSVLITRTKTHKIYKKKYTVSRKIQADDKENISKIGDIVEISPSRPLSKTKKYLLIRVVK